MDINLNTKQKSLIIPLLSCLGILFLVVFVISPLFRRIEKYSNELSLVESELIAMTERSKNLYAWKEEYPVLNPKIEELYSLFVDKEMPIDFVEFLEETALACNLDIEISLVSSVKSKQDEKPSMFLDLGFRLALVGPFSGHLKFLEKLENAPYIIDIQEFSFSQLTRTDLMQEKYKDFSIDKVKSDLSIKVFTINEVQN